MEKIFIESNKRFRSLGHPWQRKCIDNPSWHGLPQWVPLIPGWGVPGWEEGMGRPGVGGERGASRGGSEGGRRQRRRTGRRGWSKVVGFSTFTRGGLWWISFAMSIFRMCIYCWSLFWSDVCVIWSRYYLLWFRPKRASQARGHGGKCPQTHDKRRPFPRFSRRITLQFSSVRTGKDGLRRLYELR